MVLFWPLIAKAAGAILGGGGGGGMLSGILGGGAGASGGAGGILGQAGNIMGMMGGSGGPGGGIGGGQQQQQQGQQQQGGGGMLGGLLQNMMPHKMFGQIMQKRDNSNIPAAKGGPMRGYQAGGGSLFNPETMDWLLKQTGQMGQQAQVAQQDPNAIGSLPTNPVQPVDNPAVQPVEQREPLPMPSGQPQQQENPMMNVMQQVAQQQGQVDPRTTQGTGVQDTVDNPDTLNKDAEGFTKVDSLGSGMKDSMGQLQQGNILGAALAMKSHLTGMMQQGKQRKRELAQAEYMHDTAQQGSSVYNDKNSVWYSAKDGAPILPNLLHQNNNLQSVGEYQDGGNPVMERTVMGEEEGATKNAPAYVEKGKSYHYAPNAYLATIGTDKTPQTYKRTLGDMMYDVFHPNKQPRVSIKFQEGGNPQAWQRRATEDNFSDSMIRGQLMNVTIPVQRQLMQRFDRVPSIGKLPTLPAEQINNPVPTKEIVPLEVREPNPTLANMMSAPDASSPKKTKTVTREKTKNGQVVKSVTKTKTVR